MAMLIPAPYVNGTADDVAYHGVTTTEQFFAALSVSPPAVSTHEAEAIALERWGITARAKALSGERDRNFHLFAADGREFVLKFANPAEAASVRDMQSAALRHIERVDPGMVVPRVIPLPDGTPETEVPHPDGTTMHARLLSWIGGEPLRSSRRSAAQRVACGRVVARLQFALRDFSHPASDYPLFWDLRQSLRLREIAFAISHAPARALLAELLDDFERRVTPVLPELRGQVLHNDVHWGNIFVCADDHDRVAGVIDFGDMVETAVVFDLAIAASSQTGPDMGVAEALFHFVGGFHAMRPLLPGEVELLPLLIATRVAMGTTLAAWHRHTQPDSPHFALVQEGIDRRIAAITEIRSPEVQQAVRRAAGLG